MQRNMHKWACKDERLTPTKLPIQERRFRTARSRKGKVMRAVFASHVLKPNDGIAHLLLYEKDKIEIQVQ